MTPPSFPPANLYPDLDNPLWLLLAIAAALWAIAGLIKLAERRAARRTLVVVLAQCREDGAPNDGVLEQQAEHQQQQGDDAAQDQRSGGVLRGEHPASVSATAARCGACRDLSWTHTYTGDCQERRNA
jgi:hypothetical protein